MKTHAVVLCAALALAGCGSTRTIESAPKPAAQTACPPLRAWSGADLKALANALTPIPGNSVIMRMALDWRRYYGDAKACDSAQNH